jgi:hypothetical protein
MPSSVSSPGKLQASVSHGTIGLVQLDRVDYSEAASCHTILAQLVVLHWNFSSSLNVSLIDVNEQAFYALSKQF